MPTNNEKFEELAEKLLIKTTAGKIPWKGTYESSTFIAVVDGGFSFEIDLNRSGRTPVTATLRMRDEDDNPIFEMQAEQVRQDTSQINDRIWSVLRPLWDEARGTALNLRQKLTLASDALDKL